MPRGNWLVAVALTLFLALGCTADKSEWLPARVAYPGLALCSVAEQASACVYTCSFHARALDHDRACTPPLTTNTTRLLSLPSVAHGGANASSLVCVLYNRNGAIYRDGSDSVAWLYSEGCMAQYLVLFHGAIPSVLDPLSVNVIPLEPDQTLAVTIHGRFSWGYTARYSVSVDRTPSVNQSGIIARLDPLYEVVDQREEHPWSLLFDPGTWFLGVIALATIYFGSARSEVFYATVGAQLEEEGISTNTISIKLAIIMPVVGSVVLLLLFFFLGWFYYVLLVMISFSAFSGVIYLIWPWLETTRLALFRKLPEEISLPLISRYLGEVPTTFFVAAPIALGSVLAWYFTENWILSDILAVSMAMSALSVLRLPNIKVSLILLSLFFVYDIFWVFISPLFFSGQSVMVTVATSLPSLPILILMPRFYSSRMTILGLGDIILPGIFLSFCYRLDRSLDRCIWRNYFGVAFAGYAVGFAITWVMLAILLMGQPALLYLVPCVLFPTIVLALSRDEWALLWNGPQATPRRSPLSDNEDDEGATLLTTFPSHERCDGDEDGDGHSGYTDESGDNDAERGLTRSTANAAAAASPLRGHGEARG